MADTIRRDNLKLRLGSVWLTRARSRTLRIPWHNAKQNAIAQDAAFPDLCMANS